MDRSLFLGIIGGLAVFIAICSFILLNHSDFDAQLIMQVDRGVPADELIPQIDKETIRLQLNAKKRLLSPVMDRKYWGNGDLDPPDIYFHYTMNYETDMEVIEEYKNLRIKFAKHEISKEEFLNLIKVPKDYCNQNQLS